MMNVSDFGPYEGMQPSGRPIFETIVKEGSEKARSALSRVLHEQKDDVLFSLVPGHTAFIGPTKSLRMSTDFERSMLALYSTFGLLGIAILAGFFMTFFEAPGPVRHHSPIFPLMLLVIGGALLFLGGVAVRGWRNVSILGFDPANAAEQYGSAAARSWVAGAKALYVSERTREAPGVVVKTIFYDAIGRVELSQDEDGDDVLRIHGRDATVIAEFAGPEEAEGMTLPEVRKELAALAMDARP